MREITANVHACNAWKHTWINKQDIWCVKLVQIVGVLGDTENTMFGQLYPSDES